MQLKIYNTETRRKEVVSLEPGISRIRLYTCGPTIYDFAHIGNFRTYVFEDLLRRAIKFFGMQVEQAMNITDIDDKTIRGAIAKNIALKQYTEPFRIAFFEDLEKLNIEKAEHYPEATAYIPEMIKMIQTLLDKGFAYKGYNGSIYFSIRKAPSYGRLSHLKLDELKENASGENDADEYDKESAADFVLWKAYDPQRDGQIYWDSPFGKGRPGWHIECSAMSTKIFGPSLDIHCGGVDNMFPHHENEIVQSECCTGHHFVRIWAHAEHLLVDHKKMSKSLGNFYTLRDLLKKGYSGREVRYLLLSIHYRTQLNFTFAGLDAARSSLSRISDLVERLHAIDWEDKISLDLDVVNDLFKSALADDLNISAALAVLFDFVRKLNILCDKQELGPKEAKKVLQLFASWDKVLGVLPLERKQEEISEELLDFLSRREKARLEKNWRLSDEMRDEIQKRGFVIEDTPNGARLKKK
jgi:cysteinyl-tRNA synthetase